jgi:hypothetical protein
VGRVPTDGPLQTGRCALDTGTLPQHPNGIAPEYEFLARHFDFTNTRFASVLQKFRGDIFLLC